MQNVKVIDESLTEDQLKFDDALEDAVTGNLGKLDKLKSDLLRAWSHALMDQAWEDQLKAEAKGKVLEDQRVVTVSEEKYERKLTMMKRGMREEMDDLEAMAKRYKPEVLNVWWIDGLALEREAFNKGIFFEQTLFLFPKTWASRKLALENVIGAFRN